MGNICISNEEYKKRYLTDITYYTSKIKEDSSFIIPEKKLNKLCEDGNKLKEIYGDEFLYVNELMELTATHVNNLCLKRITMNLYSKKFLLELNDFTNYYQLLNAYNNDLELIDCLVKKIDKLNDSSKLELHKIMIESGYIKMNKFNEYDVKCCDSYNINCTYLNYIFSKYIDNKIDGSEISQFINTLVINNHDYSFHHYVKKDNVYIKHDIELIYKNIVMDNLFLLTGNSYICLLTRYIFLRQITTSMLWNYNNYKYNYDKCYDNINLFVISIVEVLVNGFYEEDNNKIIYVYKYAKCDYKDEHIFEYVAITKNTINKNDNNKSFNILTEWLLSSKLDSCIKKIICNHLYHACVHCEGRLKTIKIKNEAQCCECFYNEKKHDDINNIISSCKKYFDKMGIFMKEFDFEYYKKHIENISSSKCKFNKYKCIQCDKRIENSIVNVSHKIKDISYKMSVVYNCILKKIRKNKKKGYKSKRASLSSKSNASSQQKIKNMRIINYKNYKKIKNIYREIRLLISKKHIIEHGYQSDKIELNLKYLTDTMHSLSKNHSL
jgi:hypothetical protein